MEKFCGRKNTHILIESQYKFKTAHRFITFGSVATSSLYLSAPAGPASTNLHSESLCYRAGGRKGGKGGDGSGGREGEGDGELGEGEDPTVPLLRQNVYAWYLAVSIIIITCRAIVLYICKTIWPNFCIL